MDGGFASKKVPRRSRNEKQDDLQLPPHSASETRQPVNLASSPLPSQPSLLSDSPSYAAVFQRSGPTGSSEKPTQNLRGIEKKTSNKYRSDEQHRLEKELKNVTRSTDSFKEFSSLQPLSRRTVARSALGDRSWLEMRGTWGEVSGTSGEEHVPIVAFDQNTENITSALSPPSPVPQQSRLGNFFSSVAKGTSNGGDSAILAGGKTFSNPQSSLFGVSLDDLAHRSGFELPPQISNLIVTLREHLDTEGIFRMSAALRDVQLLRVAVEKGDAQAIEAASVHTLAGVLIAFLSELPEPPVSFAFYEEALAIAALPETHARTATLEALLMRLPGPSFVLLRQLAQLWQATERLSEINKMGAANLAVVFGPLVLRPTQTVLDIRLIALQNAFVEAVIRASKELFPDTISSVQSDAV